MDWSKFWPTLIPVAGLIIEAFSGAVSDALAKNPTTAILVTTIVTAIANVVKSPRR